MGAYKSAIFTQWFGDITTNISKHDNESIHCLLDLLNGNAMLSHSKVPPCDMKYKTPAIEIEHDSPGPQLIIN